MAVLPSAKTAAAPYSMWVVFIFRFWFLIAEFGEGRRCQRVPAGVSSSEMIPSEFQVQFRDTVEKPGENSMRKKCREWETNERVRTRWFGNVSFPLTPALSLGERIPQNKSRIEPMNFPGSAAVSAASILPLRATRRRDAGAPRFMGRETKCA